MLQEKYSNIITEFLRTHPLLSINAIEIELNLPQSTIAQSIKGPRFLPVKHIYSLICLLAQYGLKIDGYTISYDPSDDTISGRKFVENIKTIEEDGSFTYVIKEYRFIAADFHDLL